MSGAPTTSLESQRRHARFRKAWDQFGPKHSPADVERAFRAARMTAAERGMAELDDAIHDVASFAGDRFQRAGIPDAVADRIADEVHHAIARTVLSESNL